MNPQTQKNLLIILIPSSILIVLWIIFSVYNHSVTSTITSTQASAIQPIAPSFETTVLNRLKTRSSVAPNLTIDATPVSSQSSSTQPELSPVLVPSDEASSEAEGGNP